MTVIVSAILGVAALLQQTPPRTSAQAAPPATAVIRGHMLDAEGRPLARAVVILISGTGGFARTSLSNDDGSYQFINLQAGSYVLRGSHSGFVTLELGQQRPFEHGQPIALAAGEVRERVDLALPRHGAIVGHVADESGDPLEGVNVSVYRMGFAGGRRQLVGAGVLSQRTDDRGRFRVYGLQPGRYVVGADLGQIGREDMPGYAPTYFPGTPNAAEAQTITVGISENVTNIDFNVAAVRTARVAGRTVGSDGEPFQGGVEMRTSRRSTAVATDSFGARTERDGSFEFPNVPPGEYVIGAFKGTEACWQIVEVTGGDVIGLTVQTQPGSTITGRIIFEGGSAPARTNVNVLFAPSEPDLVPFKGTGPQADTRSDLRFDVRYANGLGRLRAVNVPSGWTLKSIVANGVDVTDTPLPFGTNDQSLKDVEILLTNQVTQLDGGVTDAAGRPVTRYHALVFSTDKDRWYEGSRFQTLLTGQRDGTFFWAGLPPGDYYVAAVDWLQADEVTEGWKDPALLESVSRAASRVTLTEGQKSSVSLKLIPR